MSLDFELVKRKLIQRLTNILTGANHYKSVILFRRAKLKTLYSWSIIIKE